jgi:hypothetical protein
MDISYYSEGYTDVKKIPMSNPITVTKTSFPAVIKNNLTSSVDSYVIKGNGSQSGTPSPDNIIMPTFCGVRTGNLYFKRIAGTNISESGTITTLTGFDLCIAKVERGVQYSGNGYIYAFFETEPTIGSISYNDSRAVNSLINVAAPISGFVAVRVSSTTQNVMCNTGSYVLPYEPYGWAEKITCAGQTIPVYLGQTQTVRWVKKLVLDGTEEWSSFEQYGVSLYRCTNDLPSKISGSPVDTMLCNVLRTVSSREECAATSNSMSVYNTQNDSRPVVNVNPMTLSDWTTFIQQKYAAGTPVCVWYVLADSTTGIVNEPLAKIGDYADELSSGATGTPTIDILSTDNTNSISFDSTIQPSSMSLTYKAEVDKVLSSDGTAVYLSSRQ